jgi:Family of unknown function (DUF6492)
MTSGPAFVAPSCPPDPERCELLAESLDRFGLSYKHYIIVDRADIAAFADLASARTILIDSRSTRIPWKGGVWLNWRTLPMRGWISQQIKKLAATKVTTEDILIMTDSDATFAKPVSAECFMIDGKNRVARCRLLCGHGADVDHGPDQIAGLADRACAARPCGPNDRVAA